jgi:hypothetical protein
VEFANAQEALTVEDKTQILKNKADIKDLEKDVRDLERRVNVLLKQPKPSAEVPPAPSEPLDRAALQSLQAQLKDLKEQMGAISNAQKVLPLQPKPPETQVDALRTVRENLSVQTKRSSELQVWVELLGLTTLLAAVLGLLQLKSLGARVGKLPGKSQPGEVRADLPLNGAPPPPEARPEGISGSHGTEAPPPSPTHHEKIAELLAELRKEAHSLAEGFIDISIRDRFLGELGAPLTARLDRLRTYSDEVQIKERWVEPDLVATLDVLARFFSEAIEEERHKRAGAKHLARKLRGWLYDRFSPACIGESWFAIDPIDPYVTAFDQNIHLAVSGRDVKGAAGKVIAIKAIGRRHPQSGAVIHKAEVIVGR